MTDLDTLNSFDQLPLYMRAMKAAEVMSNVNAHLGQPDNTLWHPASLRHWGILTRQKERDLEAWNARRANLIEALRDEYFWGEQKGWATPEAILEWALDHQSDLAKLAEKPES